MEDVALRNALLGIKRKELSTENILTREDEVNYNLREIILKRLEDAQRFKGLDGDGYTVEELFPAEKEDMRPILQMYGIPEEDYLEKFGSTDRSDRDVVLSLNGRLYDGKQPMDLYTGEDEVDDVDEDDEEMEMAAAARKRLKLKYKYRLRLKKQQ